MQRFKSAGFDVSSVAGNMGQKFLSAKREETGLQMVLKPHSPLATEIWLRNGSEGKAGEAFPADLLAYLDRYVDSLSGSSGTFREKFPAGVQSLAPLIVCIRAKLHDDEVQLSGFFIDNQGLLISTAHNLTEFHTIKIILGDGQEFEAIPVKINQELDLALLHINHKPGAYISLLQGKRADEIIGTLYSVSCFDNQPGTMRAGTIIDPPVTVDNQLLWKIEMKTFHGSSGSPVLDENGSLVGVVKGRYRGSDAIGFLIPIETVIEFLNNI